MIKKKRFTLEKGERVRMLGGGAKGEGESEVDSALSSEPGLISPPHYDLSRKESDAQQTVPPRHPKWCDV